MQWNRWYVAKSYLNSALWIVPLVALLLENVVIRLVFVLHSWLDWIPWFGTTVAGATEALNTVESLASAFIVFTFGSLLIVIQVVQRSQLKHNLSRASSPASAAAYRSWLNVKC